MDEIHTGGRNHQPIASAIGAGQTLSGGSGVSWAAIFAGAAAAAALSLILLVLGTGLGLASVSPWSSHGIGATTFGVSTILWISFVGLVASAVGGYIAGRLRTKWAGVHTDEVYFRDTAHGFLAWAVATLITAGFLTSAVTSIIGTGAQAGGSAIEAVGTAATATAGGTVVARNSHSENSGPSPLAGLGYFTDSLFRANTPTAGSAGAASAPAASPSSTASADAAAGNAGEVSRIFIRSLQTGGLAPEDTRYVGQLVASRTGMAQQDAERRVTDTFTKAQTAMRDAEAQAKDVADKARKAAAYGALWLFVSLLIGAFAASLAATYGGRLRDL